MPGLCFMHARELGPDSQRTRQHSECCAVLTQGPLSSPYCRCCGKEDKKQSKSGLMLPHGSLLAPSTHRGMRKEAAIASILLVPRSPQRGGPCFLCSARDGERPRVCSASPRVHVVTGGFLG